MIPLGEIVGWIVVIGLAATLLITLLALIKKLPMDDKYLGRLFGLVVVGVLSARAIFQRALGGITGDALGATGEVMEVLLLAGAALSIA